MSESFSKTNLLVSLRCREAAETFGLLCRNARDFEQQASSKVATRLAYSLLTLGIGSPLQVGASAADVGRYMSQFQSLLDKLEKQLRNAQSIDSIGNALIELSSETSDFINVHWRCFDDRPSPSFSSANYHYRLNLSCLANLLLTSNNTRNRLIYYHEAHMQCQLGLPVDKHSDGLTIPFKQCAIDRIQTLPTPLNRPYTDSLPLAAGEEDDYDYDDYNDYYDYSLEDQD